MREAITTLWDELSGLAEDYSGLGKQFQQASRRLQTPGALPESELTEKVVGLRSRFGSLRSRLESAGATLAVSAPPTGGAETLRDLALWLEELTAAEERAARRAARDGAADGVLERVLALRHDREPAFEPLERCREQARTLRDGIRSAAPGLDEVRDALADNDHPFAYLLIMVGGAEGVSDDLWEGLFEAVGREFGRPLAAAAARGKLVAGEPEPAAREPVEVPEEPARDTGRGADAPVVVTLRRDAGSPPLRGPLGPSSGRKEPIADRGVIDPALVALTSEDLLTPIAEEAFPFLPGGLAALLASNGKARHAALRAVPRVERLETVRLLSCNVIAGHVFLDANNNGLLESSETRVPGNVIELRNADGIVVGRATTGADGSYSFSTDGTVSTEPVSVSQSLAIPATPTNFAAGLPIARFDPSLGALLGVEITVQGRLSSLIRAENTSAHSSQTIQATVEGELRLAGPGFDFSATLANSGGSFDATAFDGAADYGGTSGHDFGVQTATIDRTFVLSRDGGDDLSSFVGSGELAGTFEARASSRATGGGNIDYDTRSTGEAVVTVVYRYTPDNCLAPGNYTLVQPDQPPGTLNGKRSSEGDVFAPPASGPDTIPVTLDGRDLLDNDFGELLPADLSGFVYVDANNDGVRAASEAPIPGAALTLTGTDDLGNPVSRSAVTAADGAYLFDGLRPGTYRIVETQPAGFLDGKDSVGSLGGVTGDDAFSAVVLGQGADGVDYNFGEISVASLSGFVYHDRDDDGLKAPGEPGIPGVTVTLTGTDDGGNPVAIVAVTDADGAYSFPSLRPGSYRIEETQPAGYLDGTDALGSQGGVLGDDRIDVTSLLQGVHGVDNNFGEVLPGGLNGFVYFDANRNGLRDPGERGFAGIPIRLNGTNALGAIDPQFVTTDENGFYSFGGLRPGAYSVTQTVQPAVFVDGQETRGNVFPLDGSRGTDEIPGITVNAGGVAPDNNFGEEVVPRVEPEVITQVEDVTRLGIHHQPTRFLLRFSNEVDPGSAGDPANYRLVQASWSGRLARRPIPLRSAAYDPPTRTVTLTTLRPINIYRPYQLTVNGVLDAQGDPIDGDRDGNPGGAFVTTVTRANYPYPLNPAAIQAQKAVEWAGKYPRLAAQRLAEGPRPRRS